MEYFLKKIVLVLITAYYYLFKKTITILSQDYVQFIIYHNTVTLY